MVLKQYRLRVNLEAIIAIYNDLFWYTVFSIQNERYSLYNNL